MPLSTAADQLQLLIVAASVVAEGLDDASGSRFDPAEPGRARRCDVVDAGSGASEPGEDRLDARRAWCQASPDEQNTHTDAGSQQDYDERGHVSAPTCVGPPARAVNRSGSSMSAMRVRSQPPTAKMPPTMANMTWPPALSYTAR